jgi:hypothetical protein
VNRLDRQAEVIPANWLAGIQSDINELKSSSQAIGPDSLSIKRVVSGNTWDINGDSIAASIVQSYLIQFTPTTATNAYVELTYLETIGNADGFEKTFVWPDTSNTSSAVRSWRFTLANDVHAITLFVQFVLKCLDTGTITVTKL